MSKRPRAVTNADREELLSLGITIAMRDGYRLKEFPLKKDGRFQIIKEGEDPLVYGQWGIARKVYNTLIGAIEPPQTNEVSK